MKNWALMTVFNTISWWYLIVLIFLATLYIVPWYEFSRNQLHGSTALPSKWQLGFQQCSEIVRSVSAEFPLKPAIRFKIVDVNLYTSFVQMLDTFHICWNRNASALQLRDSCNWNCHLCGLYAYFWYPYSIFIKQLYQRDKRVLTSSISSGSCSTV